jgi:sulfoxide reductase heme-binding subunit YedZ
MEWSEMHRWNRATGDMSLIMVAIAMSLGPLSRLSNRFRWIVPLRRELGIYGVLLAGIHIVIILAAWVEWDLVRLFGYEIHPTLGRYVMVQHGFGLANAIGIVAVIYAIALALSSNDWSQKKLGAMVWKFFQQSAYVYWMLIVVHTAYFLYLHFQDFHRRTPDPNWAQLPFVILVVLVLSLQTAAFIKTWKLSSRSA